MFKVLYCQTSVKGGAHIHMNIWYTYAVRMSPALHRSSVMQGFEHCDVIKMCYAWIALFPD